MFNTIFIYIWFELTRFWHDVNTAQCAYKHQLLASELHSISIGCHSKITKDKAEFPLWSCKLILVKAVMVDQNNSFLPLTTYVVDPTISAGSTYNLFCYMYVCFPWPILFSLRRLCRYESVKQIWFHWGIPDLAHTLVSL